MAHPFLKLFDSALRKSTDEHNVVTDEARKLLKKGYREEEVCRVLLTLEKSLIDDKEAERVREAREEICDEAS